MPYSLPIRQTYSTCRTANSFLRLLSDHRLYTTCSSTGGRLTARIWQRLNLLVGSRIDPYLFHRNNYTLRSIPFTIFSWSTTILPYLSDPKGWFLYCLHSKGRFLQYSPPTRSLFELSIPRRLHIDSVQSKTTHAKENYYIYDRPFPTVCKPRLFSLSYVLSSQRGEEKTKVRRLSWMLEKFDTKRMVGRDDRSIRSNEGDVSGQLNRSQKNFAGSTSPPMIILLAPGGQ